MPTLLDAIDCKTKFKNPIDGVSQWDQFIGENNNSAREEILHNIDPTKNDTVTTDHRVWDSKWDVRIQAAIRSRLKKIQENLTEIDLFLI